MRLNGGKLAWKLTGEVLQAPAHVTDLKFKQHVKQDVTPLSQTHASCPDYIKMTTGNTSTPDNKQCQANKNRSEQERLVDQPTS